MITESAQLIFSIGLSCVAITLSLAPIVYILSKSYLSDALKLKIEQERRKQGN